jgi:hypothetical protein
LNENEKQSARQETQGRIPIVGRRKWFEKNLKQRKEVLLFFVLFFYILRPTFSIVSNNFSIDLVRQRLLLSIWQNEIKIFSGGVLLFRFYLLTPGKKN